MLRVGIIGEFQKTSQIISSILLASNKTVKIASFSSPSSFNPPCDLLLTNLHFTKNQIQNPNNFKLDVIILNKLPSFSNLSSLSLPSNFSSNSILIINIDNIKKLTILKKTSSYIVTTGLNSKASVTVSSLNRNIYNTFQICIQRSLPSISGNIIEEHEFSVNTSHKNITAILSAVTLALISDTEIPIKINL